MAGADMARNTARRQPERAIGADAMKILEVIESRRWKNTKTGATASFYGAVPYTTLADESNWEVETVGYTWRNSNGTIGLGRAPAKTYEEAVAVMEHANSISDSFADEMARAAAVDHDTAETVERLREIQGEIRELIDEALTQVKLIDRVCGVLLVQAYPGRDAHHREDRTGA
jgi:hypothetical protein